MFVFMVIVRVCRMYLLMSDYWKFMQLNFISCHSGNDLQLYFEICQGNSLMRILNVAAFAVSGYASTEGRICKPFNPLLGETYEADYPDKGLRFFSEKVSFSSYFYLHILYNLIFCGF